MTPFYFDLFVITDLPKSLLLQLNPKPDALIHLKIDKLCPFKLNLTDNTAKTYMTRIITQTPITNTAVRPSILVPIADYKIVRGVTLFFMPTVHSLNLNNTTPLGNKTVLYLINSF
jgi:hypothetical protein